MRHVIALVPLLVAAALGAQTPNAHFAVERPVTPGAAGPNRLPLDATLLARARPFRVDQVTASAGRVGVAVGGAGDLRLFDAAGREVPYLLLTPKVEASWRAGRLLRVAPTKTTSGFEVDLESALSIDRVRFQGLPAPFLKRVRIEGSGDRARWTILAGEETLFDLPAERLERTELEFASGEYRYLRLTWDDRSSARMPMPHTVEARVASPVRAPAPLRASVAVERRASEPGKSRFRLRLPGAHLPIVALDLSIGGGNVLRAARVTEGRLVGGEVVPTELGTATLRRAVRDGVAASELRIPIAQPAEAELDLVVDDGDNPPLDVTGVTAIFATLPFVYFESANGAPLVARYGDERLAAPRYDLEAVRDRVPALRLAEARWGEPREAVGASSVASSELPTAGAAIDASRFRYRRVMPLGGAGLATVQLDAAVLAHASLADLRIATADGRQVPFLIERRDEPLSVPLALPAREAVGRGGAADRSSYTLRLPYSHLPASRLVLSTDARVFERRVAVEIEPSADDARPRRRGERVRVASMIWRHTDPELPAPALSIEIPPLRPQDIVLTVDEGDNAPLPLREATLLLPSYRLRFFRDGRTSLALLYGQPDLPPPRYDLALLAPRLLGAPAEEVTIAGEQGANVTGVTPTVVFWSALAVAVGALLVLIARLVRPGSSAPSASASVAPDESSAPPPTTPAASE